MLDLTTTARIIKEGRKMKGLTQDELAEVLHVSKQAVSNWERGKNLPDEGTRDAIEGILGVKLRSEKMSREVKTPFDITTPEIKPLEEIDSVGGILAAVEAIIESVKIDQFEHTVRRMLYLTLVEILGYEIYYESHCCKYYDDDPLDWACTASDLQSFISNSDDWPLEKTTFTFQGQSRLAKKVEWMAYQIGGELFEDFDDDGYRDCFEQQIGKYGENYGNDLFNLLPEFNTDIMVIYKTAILDIVEMLSNVA